MSSLICPGILAVILIDQLGSPSFVRRQKAMQSLTELAPVIVPYLESGRRHADPEVSRRSDVILAGYFEQSADQFVKQALPHGWTYLPWVDMLPKDYPDRTAIVEYFVAQAREKIGRKGPPDWDDYRLATQLYLHHLFVNQTSLEQAVELLDRMAARQRQWVTENGKNYSPTLKTPPCATGQ